MVEKFIALVFVITKCKWWCKYLVIIIIVVVQFLSHVWLFVTPRTAACEGPLSFTIFWSLLKFMTIESMMLSNHLILCHPLHHVPSIFPSIQVFSNKLALCIRWPKHWSFSFSISPCYSLELCIQMGISFLLSFAIYFSSFHSYL